MNPEERSKLNAEISARGNPDGMARKPRGDSVLKTLPEDQQQEIIDKIKEPKATYRKVRAWLLMDRRIATNEASLGDFFSWWHLQQRWKQASERGRDVQELLAASDPSLSLEQIEAAGQLVFMNEAIEAGGTAGLKGFATISRLRLSQKAHDAELRGFKLKYEQKEREIAQKDAAHALAEAKFKRDTCELFLTWCNDERAKAITSSGATNAEKIEQLGQAMFGEDWDK